MKKVLGYGALFGGGGILLLVAVLWVWGAMLPEQHKLTRSVALAVPAEDVWSVIHDIPGTAAWRSGVDSVTTEQDEVGGTFYREVNEYGEFCYAIEVAEPPSRLVTRIVGNDQFGGCWTYELKPSAAGCELSVTEDGEVYSPLMRFFSTYVFGLDTTVEAYLADLEARMTLGS